MAYGEDAWSDNPGDARTGGGRGPGRTGSGGGRRGGGSGGGEAYNPCPGQSEWVSMPVEQGYPAGGYWRCTGPASGPSRGGGGFNYQTPEYTGPSRPQYNIGTAPGFDAPDFNAPTADSIYADPSYQFRLDQGRGALEASAAARGVTRSGGTLQDILEYGQNFASQEYGNIYNRALQDYDREFRARYEEYQPRFREWETRAGAEIGAGNLAFQAALDRYFFGINDEFRRQQMLFNAGLA